VATDGLLGCVDHAGSDLIMDESLMESQCGGIIGS
jgi:hypothetical protein